MTATILPLRDEHMMHLAGHLRPMDRLEVVSLMPDQPVSDVLVASARASLRGRAGFWNGDLVACWGVTPRTAAADEGAPWLLATSLIDRPEVRRAFVTHGKAEMLRLTEGFHHLWNVVHRENIVARRWLRVMGFEFRDTQEYFMSGEPFVRFEMEAA